MRIIKVLVLLLVLGACAGAIVGVLFLLGLTLFTPVEGGTTARMYGAATGFGAAVGALFGPPIALLFLRRVPLWRATVETAGAAGLGAAVGGFTKQPWGWAVLALVFALAAALRLHRKYRQPAQRAIQDEP